MGRIGGWFKKSGDKEKAAGPAVSNPYAQQPSVTDPSLRPPQYDQYNQYNNNQFNDNQSVSRPPPPTGLPSGPRPGGLPARVAPGPARTDTFASTTTSGFEKSPPPQYSPQGAQLPPYEGGSSSTGFSKEKYGAADGFGRNRFESPAPARYDPSASQPSGTQGGYGNLDTGSGALFAGYNGPPKQTTRPRPGQTSGPYDPSMGQEEPRELTEEELLEAQVDDTKAQILEAQAATNDVGRRNYARLVEANERMNAMNSQLLQNTDTLNKAELNMDQTKAQADVGSVNLDDLDAANTSMFNLYANSKARIAQRAEKKMTIQQQHQLALERTRQEEHDLERKWAAESQTHQKTKVLGGPKAKTDSSRFEFEDDDGQQRANNEEYDVIVDGLAEQTSQLRKQAEFQGFILKDQLKQIDRMNEKAGVADDKIAKNRFRLDTKYNK